jgi:hypothetical protein
MKAIICLCAVIVTAIAIYFFWQDRAEKAAYAKNEIWRKHDQAVRGLEEAYGIDLDK